MKSNDSSVTSAANEDKTRENDFTTHDFFMMMKVMMNKAAAKAESRGATGRISVSTTSYQQRPKQPAKSLGFSTKSRSTQTTKVAMHQKSAVECCESIE